MPDETDDFEALMEGIRCGSEQAAWELVERYGPELRRAVRRALSARLRPKFDSLDFVQLVWCSFFRNSERVVRFSHPEDLVAFLTQLATNKVIDETRRRLVLDQRNVNRERPLRDVPEDHPSFTDPAPAAIDVVIAHERWEEIVSEQPDKYRRIIELRLLGMSNYEIGKRLQIAHTTVDRFLERLLYEKLGKSDD
jgi:RNA polymerase sigma-70 factor (ECF subfamily)